MEKKYEGKPENTKTSLNQEGSEAEKQIKLKNEQLKKETEEVRRDDYKIDEQIKKLKEENELIKKKPEKLKNNSEQEEKEKQLEKEIKERKKDKKTEKGLEEEKEENKNELNFENDSEEEIKKGNEISNEKNKKLDYESKNQIKNFEANDSTTFNAQKEIENIEYRKSIQINKDIKFFKEEIKKISKKVYKNSINIIIGDLEESFNDLESIDYNSKVKIKYEKKVNEIKLQIFKIFDDNYQIKKNKLKDIIYYLRNNPDLLLKKTLYNSINFCINLIEGLKDDIYMDKEEENLKNDEINGTKIELSKIINISSDLQKNINEFIKNPTKLILNFVKLNPSNNFYDKLRISEKIYQIKEDKFELTLQDLISYNGFDAQVNLELFDDNKNKSEFLINITLYTENQYDIFLDIKKDKTYSAEIIYVSNQNDLLPKEVKISGKIIPIKTSLSNMKRIVLLNISKIELINYLSEFSFFDEEKRINIEKNVFSREKSLEISDLFINIIIDKEDEKNEITAYHNAKIIPKDFTEDDKNIINNCYDELKNIENNFNINDEIILKFLSAIGKDTLEKAFKVLENFIRIPFYIDYKDKKPDENIIEIIKKA